MVEKWILAVVVMFACTGCAPTYCKNDFFHGGYTNTKVSDNYYSVSYQTGCFNNVTNPAKRDQTVMFRAAELTLENGFTHFLVDQVAFSTFIRCYQSDEAPQEAYSASSVMDCIKQQRIES